MAALLGSVRKFLNSLLPFTNPNTPLVKDLLHASILIVIFYFGPRWMEMWRRRRKIWAEQREEQEQGEGEHVRIPRDTRPAGPQIPQADEHARHELDNGRNEANIWPNAHEHINHADHNNAIPPDAALPLPAEPPRHEAIAPPQPPRQPTHRDPRTIGAKKAKSIARRDQRRAYNEFMRSQGDEQRARDAADAAEREEAVFEEKRRRAAIEMEVEERVRREREEEKRRAEEERTKEWRRREEVVQKAKERLDRRGYVELMALGDREDVERLVRASGMLGTRKRDGVKEITMVTRDGWLVRVDEGIMKQLYSTALKMESGRVGFEKMGDMLGGIMRERAAITSANR